MCAMTYSFVRRDSFRCVTWLIHMCDTSHKDTRLYCTVYMRPQEMPWLMMTMHTMLTCFLIFWRELLRRSAALFCTPVCVCVCMCVCERVRARKRARVRACAHVYANVRVGCSSGTIVCTENAARPKSTKSRNSDSPVSRGTNPNREFGLMWICTEEFQLLNLVDCRGVAFFSGICLRALTMRNVTCRALTMWNYRSRNDKIELSQWEMSSHHVLSWCEKY